jgi:hypothetical protein
MITKKLITILLLSFSSLSIAQIGDIRIYNGDDYKCNLHQINDSLVYLTFEEFSGFSSYYLGQFEINEDSLIIKEVSDRIVIKRDVYYRKNKDVHSDSLQIEYLNHDFIIPNCMFTAHDSAFFQIDNEVHMASKGMLEGSLKLVVSKPLSENIDLKIADKYGLLCDTSIQVPKDINNILIKEFSVFSLVVYYTETFQELIPREIEIQGKKLKLGIYLE